MEDDQISNDHHRSLIQSVLQPYDFDELNNSKESSNNDEEIIIKTIHKGVFRNKDGCVGIFCKFIDTLKLKPSMQECLANRFEVESIYEGDKYLLCMANKSIYSFNISYYIEVLSIINDIDVEMHFSEKKLSIGIDKKK